MKREHVGAILIGLMAAATMAGSVSGLVHFAQLGSAGSISVGDAALPVGTIAFVAGLDGLAISLTILAHRKGSTDWVAFGGLVLATLASTVLQVAAVWSDGPAAIIVHGSPAPCTGVAAFFLLRSLGHAPPVAPPPPPPSEETTGGLIVEASAPEPAGATAGPPPTSGVPPTSGIERRPTSSAPRTQGSGGRTGQSRATPGSAPETFEELVSATARLLMKNGWGLSKRKVELAVREIRGTCSRETRDQVYEALLVDEAMAPVTDTEPSGDHSHAPDPTPGDPHVS